MALRQSHIDLQPPVHIARAVRTVWCGPDGQSPAVPARRPGPIGVRAVTWPRAIGQPKGAWVAKRIELGGSVRSPSRIRHSLHAAFSTRAIAQLMMRNEDRYCHRANPQQRADCKIGRPLIAVRHLRAVAARAGLEHCAVERCQPAVPALIGGSCASFATRGLFQPCAPHGGHCLRGFASEVTCSHTSRRRHRD